MKVLGIDPGLSGGCSFLSKEEIHMYKTPVLTEEFVKAGKKRKRKSMDLITIVSLIKEHNPTHAVLEKVASRPGEGSTSSFRFGMGLGEWRGILSALRIPFITPTPQQWKKKFALTSDKETSLVFARTTWPEHAIKSLKYKNCDGVAESAILAKYGFDNPDLFD